MNPLYQKLLAVWASILIVVICAFSLALPTWHKSILCLISLTCVWGYLYVHLRYNKVDLSRKLIENLPDHSYRLPVVLCCGDNPSVQESEPTVTLAQNGCWIYLPSDRDLFEFVQGLLIQRPDWFNQLSIKFTICPQYYTDTAQLKNRLLKFRWQLTQVKRKLSYSLPVLMNFYVASQANLSQVWQSQSKDEPIQVWTNPEVPRSLKEWLGEANTSAMSQQLVFNAIKSWANIHVLPILTDDKEDLEKVKPSIWLWCFNHALSHEKTKSLWQQHLSKITGLNQVNAWQANLASQSNIQFANFILPLLPKGKGYTPKQRAYLYALFFFLCAIGVGVMSSAWNNSRLINGLYTDLRQYHQIKMDDYQPKAKALNQLKHDLSYLDTKHRKGVPLTLGFSLYRADEIYSYILEAMRHYQAPPKPQPKALPKMVRLNSLSLFDSGKAQLKAGSTKVLVQALVDIKAKPDWLIVIAGHTDTTGSADFNQKLSLKRAEAVRDWMRDTGDLPESCFAVQGFGQTRPIASNETVSGRSANRRVEISLIPQADACRTTKNPKLLIQKSN